MRVRSHRVKQARRRVRYRQGKVMPLTVKTWSGLRLQVEPAAPVELSTPVDLNPRKRSRGKHAGKRTSVVIRSSEATVVELNKAKIALAPPIPAAAPPRAPLLPGVPDWLKIRLNTHSLTAIDLFRGLTIMEVVFHHASGMALRHLPRTTPLYGVTEIVNRTLHYAVPAFVFLTVVVLTSSLLRRYDLRRYFSRRVVRAAWPYLLWSVLYMLWYVWTGVRKPETLTDPQQWKVYLFYGKASFHLYFLLVALEVYLILPLLIPLARLKPRIWQALLIGLALQLGFFFLNHSWLRLPYPASTVFWYILPITVGLAVGARLDEFQRWWRDRRLGVFLALAVAYALYLPLALAFLRGEKVTPLYHNTASWSFSILMALTLLGVSFSLYRYRHWLGMLVSALGSVSLQIYLLHPAVLQLLENYYVPQEGPGAIVLLSILYGLLGLFVPFGVGQLLRRTHLSVPIFGRN